METPSILVVDDNPDLAQLVRALLEESGMSVRLVESGKAALEALDETYFDLVLSDVKMPGMDGLELLQRMRASYPEIPVVLLTGFGTVEMAVQAMRAGAASFVVKPYRDEVLVETVRQALRTAPPEEAFPRDREEPATRATKAAPRSPWRTLLEKAAASDATLFLRGETGTGKSREARRVHSMSPRKKGPFVEVHCACFPETLLDGELFGWKRGAHATASHDRPGRVELAEGGTLFLDEIGDLDLRVQAKLLRLLEEKQYEPLGSKGPQKANVRFIVATDRDVEADVKSGAMRNAFLQRMNELPVVIPPLRERADEIEPLAIEFLERFSRENGKPEIRFGDGALKPLLHFEWLGNVRQLENTVERLVVFSDAAQISRDDVERALGSCAPRADDGGGGGSLLLKDVVSHAERKAMLRALSRAEGNRAKAARLLGIARRTLYNKLAEYGLMKWRTGDPE